MIAKSLETVHIVIDTPEANLAVYRVSDQARNQAYTRLSITGGATKMTETLLGLGGEVAEDTCSQADFKKAGN